MENDPALVQTTKFAFAVELQTQALAIQDRLLSSRDFSTDHVQCLRDLAKAKPTKQR